VPPAHGGEFWDSATRQLLKDSISRPGMGGSKRMSTSKCVWVPARTACNRHLITAVTEASQSVPPQKEHTLRSTGVNALATHTAQFINSLLAEIQKEAAAHPRTSQQRCRTWAPARCTKTLPFRPFETEKHLIILRLSSFVHVSTVYRLCTDNMCANKPDSYVHKVFARLPVQVPTHLHQNCAAGNGCNIFPTFRSSPPHPLSLRRSVGR
jgi:hypothetical protein